MKTHLDYLNESLFREQARLAAATNPAEIALRSVWVDGKKKEIANEIEFLKANYPDQLDQGLADDQLLAELFA